MDSDTEEKVCRLCANRGYNYRPIFDSNGNSIVKKIHNCLPVVINSNDQLPAHICTYCLRSLNVSDKLRTRCLLADTILRKQLQVVLSKVTIQENNAENETELLDLNSEKCDVKKHTGSVIEWICDYCDKKFKTSADLLQHKHRNHKINKQCPNDAETDETFDVFYSVIDDDVSEHSIDVEEYNYIGPDSEWICTFCKDIFESSADLLKHKSDKHENAEHIEDTEINENTKDSDNLNEDNIEKAPIATTNNSDKSNENNIVEDAINTEEFNKDTFKSSHNLPQHQYNNHNNQKEDIENVEMIVINQNIDNLNNNNGNNVETTSIAINENSKSLNEDNAENAFIFITIKPDELNDNNVVKDPSDTQEESNLYKDVDWICQFCGNVFTSLADLLQHQHDNHSNEKDCSEIGEMDKIYENFDNLNKNDTSDVLTSIDIIEKKNAVVEGSTDAEEHTTIFQDLNWICEFCEKIFMCPDALLQHKHDDHRNEAQYITDIEMNEDAKVSDRMTGDNINKSSTACDEIYCKTCKIAFENMELMELHKKFHQPRPMFCSVCRKGWPSPYKLFRHKQKIHHLWPKLRMKWFCETCELLIKDPGFLRKHVNKCDKKKSKCKYCNQEFIYKLQLMVHQRKAHYVAMFEDPDIEKLQCQYCDKIFIDKTTYLTHGKKHPEAENDKSFEKRQTFKCDYCPKIFYRENIMKKHRRIHFKFKCSHCNEHFETLADLDDHLRGNHKTETMWFKITEQTEGSK